MKVLGISFGRKGERCDILVKEALYGAKAQGAEVEFVNTIDMNIMHCKGCGACSKIMEKGGNVRCILKDDYLALEEKILDADGIIIASPVYSVGTSGQLKCVTDRFGAAHDRATMLEENKKRMEAGKTGDELLDPRYLKDRYVAYISVGGAWTHNWVCLGLPVMNLFGISQNMKHVGQIDAYDQGRTANPVFDRQLIDRCNGLGRHVAECLGKPYDEAGWFGEERVCPVCHNDLIMLSPDMSTRVECPVCGIYGELSIKDGKVSVDFSDEEKARARWTINGLYEHHNEIAGMMEVCIPKLMENKETLPKLLERYKNFDELIQKV